MRHSKVGKEQVQRLPAGHKDIGGSEISIHNAEAMKVQQTLQHL